MNESLGEPKLIAGVLAAAVGYWITIMSTSMVHALIENTTYQIADNTMPTLDVLILLFAFSYYCFVRHCKFSFLGQEPPLLLILPLLCCLVSTAYVHFSYSTRSSRRLPS